MSTLIHDLSDSQTPPLRSYFAWGAIILLSMGLFLLAPGDVEQKAHLALHGVCAQRPSHSLQLGGATLPLDARMTGIYLGAITTALWLIATRRLRLQARPSLPVLATLVLFLLVMAADGSNAFLVDLGLAGFYQPSNTLRLATGILAGVSLGTGFGYLFAITIWRSGQSPSAIVGRPADLVVPTAFATALGALVLIGPPVLFAPLAIGLMIAVISVFAALILILIALASGRAWRFDRYDQLRGLATMSYLLAMLILVVLSGLRIIAEQAFGLPQLT